MNVPPWLWIVVTLGGVVCQTFRNASQRSITGALGGTGATYIRFLFALPTVLFIGILLAALGHPMPQFGWVWAINTVAGAMGQILATALMLAAMQERAFVVAIAYTKVEPVLVAVFSFAVLGETMSVGVIVAVLIVTGAVIALSWPQRDQNQLLALRPAALGLGAGALFAFSTIAYRAAILELHAVDYFADANWTLALALSSQTAVLTAWLWFTDRKVLAAVAREWRPSVLAGTFGAIASECWLLAFAIETATRVRTLALSEILLAFVVSRRLFAQFPSKREMVSIAVMVVGLVILVNS